MTSVLMGRDSALSRKLRGTKPVTRTLRSQQVMSRPWGRRLRKSRRPRAKRGSTVHPLVYPPVHTHKGPHTRPSMGKA